MNQTPQQKKHKTSLQVTNDIKKSVDQQRPLMNKSNLTQHDIIIQKKVNGKLSQNLNSDLDEQISDFKQNANMQNKQDSQTRKSEEDNNNTITVNKSKVVGGMNFHFVSVSPSKKQTVDKQQQKNFKLIQEDQLKNWKGINIKFTMRPGMFDLIGIMGNSILGDKQNENTQSSSGATVVYDGNGDMAVLTMNQNKQKSQTNNNFYEELKQYAKIEDKRMKQMLDLLLRYRDWEEEKIKIQLMQGTTNDTSDSQQNYQTMNSMNNIDQFISQNAQQQQQNIQNNLKTEFVNFKPLKDSSILIRDGQSTIYFQKGAILNTYMKDSENEMFFKLVKCENKLMRAVLENNAFQQTETHDWNILWSSQSYKTYIYDNLNEYQKINHFPNSFELTRKDRLCANIVKMQEKFGKETFNIIPDTYNLPDEFADFYSHFHKLKSQGQDSNQWIIKPQNMCQGKGIYIIDDVSEVPIDEPCVISKYVHNPLLINGLKFDIRIYVCVTSMDPWRIYVYNEGLVRFASEEYNASNIKSNKFAHLTNYSINKKSETFVQNQNADQSDLGHKWSIGALTKHLEGMGIDNDLLWSKIYDVILKSLLAVDGYVQQQLKKSNSKNNCFELFGFDVMIDSDLKPWLLEVNLSPSLACDSPIDLKIKHALFLDTMNLISIRKFDRRRENLNKMKLRAKNIVRAKSYQSRQNITSGGGNKVTEKSTTQTREKEFGDGNLSTTKNAFQSLQLMQMKYKDTLRETLQEHFRKGGFLRIYPSKNSNIYDQYFTSPTSVKPMSSSNVASQIAPNQGNQIMKTTNKILHKLLFSDELIPYQNQMVIKKLGRTISKNQQVLTPIQSAQSSSNQGTQDFEENKNEQVQDSNKKSFQKLSRVQQYPKNQHQTPQKLGSNMKIERGSGRHLLPALTNNNLQVPANHHHSAHSSHSGNYTLQNRSNSANKQGNQENKKDKLLITGDDILIEYVARLMIAVKSIKENMLKAQWIHQIEKFIKHQVWHSSDVRRAQNNKLWQRLESRLIEMKERRRRLLQSLYKKELKSIQDSAAGFSANRQAQQADIDQFQKEYKFREEQKNVIIQGFSAQQLEEMLYTSTKNVAYEVISCLISIDNSSQKEQDKLGNPLGKIGSGLVNSNVNCKGVLTDIIKWLTMTNQQQMLNDVQFSILDQISTKQSRDDYPSGQRRKIIKGSIKKQKQQDPNGLEDETESYQIIEKGTKNNNSLKSIDQYDTGDYSIQNRKQTINPVDNDGRVENSQGLFSDQYKQLPKYPVISKLSNTGKKNRIIISDDLRQNLKYQNTEEKRSIEKVTFSVNKLNLMDDPEPVTKIMGNSDLTSENNCTFQDKILVKKTNSGIEQESEVSTQQESMSQSKGKEYKKLSQGYKY